MHGCCFMNLNLLLWLLLRLLLLSLAWSVSHRLCLLHACLLVFPEVFRLGNACIARAGRLNVLSERLGICRCRFGSQRGLCLGGEICLCLWLRSILRSAPTCLTVQCWCCCVCSRRPQGRGRCVCTGWQHILRCEGWRRLADRRRCGCDGCRPLCGLCDSWSLLLPPPLLLLLLPVLHLRWLLLRWRLLLLLLLLRWLLLLLRGLLLLLCATGGEIKAAPKPAW